MGTIWDIVGHRKKTQFVIGTDWNFLGITNLILLRQRLNVLKCLGRIEKTSS